ncbi:MAG: hypothetical protein KF787_00890 [Phycisphaeraceae bacterium]|nr:hypothetical protein [Phycisphaerae bacterium]MBX3391178.1 hypothetical protein [Phycisphaeraceae bacterium]
MSTGTSLSQRLQAEFAAREQRVKAQEQTRAEESKRREERLEKFTKVCDEMKSVWSPRIDEFVRQFGDQIKVVPSITPSQREAKVVFLTDLASMTLTLSVAPNADVTSMVLGCELLIIPMVFEYERFSRLEMPLDKIDKEAVGKWIDDRLVACAKAFLSVKDNNFYIQRAMVEDPVSKVKFLRTDAAATLEHMGHTYYFASEETLKQYKQQQQITD